MEDELDCGLAFANPSESGAMEAIWECGNIAGEEEGEAEDDECCGWGGTCLKSIFSFGEKRRCEITLVSLKQNSQVSSSLTIHTPSLPIPFSHLFIPPLHLNPFPRPLTAIFNPFHPSHLSSPC